MGRIRLHAGRLLRHAAARTTDPRPLREQLGLTRLEPVSRQFGFDRGKPVDRWYIERFLAQQRADVRGRVLEIAETTYTKWYGDGEVTSSDVLHKDAIPEATIVGDLTDPATLPDGTIDCFICTQTFQVIEDVEAAVRGAHHLLAPGGVLLATLPGISQTSPHDKRDWGDWHRFTEQGTRKLFGGVFGPDRVDVEVHGNVLTACAFLYGFAAEELTEDELAFRDEHYDLLLTVRAVKGG